MDAVQSTEAVKETPKTGGFGKVERFNIDNNAAKVILGEEIKPIVPKEEPAPIEETAKSENPKEVAPKESKETPKAEQATKETEKQPAEEKQPTADLSDEQIKEYFKKQGIEYDGVDSLKKKLKPTEESLSEERRAQIEHDKKLADLFISGGGDLDQYIAIKSIKDKPLAELSMEVLSKELSDQGLSKEEIDEYVKDKYFQMSDEDIEAYEDEADRVKLKKLKAYGKKQLDAYATNTHNQANKIFADLNNSLESDRLYEESEAKLSSKIEDTFKKVQRKLKFELGEINGKPLSPMQFEISDADIEDVKSQLLDISKRQQLLQTKDGDLNTESLSNLLVRNKILESAIKVAYLEGLSVKEETLDSVGLQYKNPYDVGLKQPSTQNGKNGGKFGKVERYVPSTNYR